MGFIRLIKSNISRFKLILFFWLLLTALNINKAYHIDDTFHLEAAQWIKGNPLKPMSGLINWDDSPEKIFNYNQPPLFFYIIAFSQLFLGDSEIAMHLLLSIFTFLSLYYFFRLALLIKSKHPNIMLTIFAFCPALVVNQNLMIDVPILSLTLATAFYLIKAQHSNHSINYFKASLSLSVGLMMKYSLLPLLVPLIFSILIFRRYKALFVVLVPIIILGLWSVWNILEMHSIHLFNRPKSEFNINNLFAFMSVLGSISTIAIIYIYSVYPRRAMKGLLLLGIVFFLTSGLLVYQQLIDEQRFALAIDYVFMSVGFALSAIIIYYFIKSFNVERLSFFKTDRFIILLFIGGMSLFIVLFAPFNATRHVLLVVPFIIIFSNELIERADTIVINLTLTVTVFLGIVLGISDWVYADFYRKSAEKVNVKESTVWSVGHWGWQWYSKKNGMKIYSKGDDLLVRNGNIVVYSNNIARQAINKELQLEKIDMIVEKPTLLTFFSGKNFASMYNSFLHKPSWTLSNRRIDTIFVCRVKREIEISDIVNRIKSDESWFNSVKEKAIKNSIPLDSMLVLDAKWVIEQKRR